MCHERFNTRTHTFFFTTDTEALNLLKKESRSTNREGGESELPECCCGNLCILRDMSWIYIASVTKPEGRLLLKVTSFTAAGVSGFGLKTRFSLRSARCAARFFTDWIVR